MISLKRKTRNGEDIKMIKPKESDNQKKIIDLGKPISESEIKNYLYNVNNFYGCIDVDKLGEFKFPSSNFWGIIVFIPHKLEKDIRTGHWVALTFDNQYYFQVCFFDSFGRSPQQLKIGNIIEDFIARWIEYIKPKLLLKYKINGVKLQKGEEKTCGSYVIQFIIDILINKKNFKEASNYTDSILKREKLIKRFNYI